MKKTLLGALLLLAPCVHAEVWTEGEIVDMGLSVKWRGWNIGATAPYEVGDTYAFADTKKGGYDVKQTYPYYSWDISNFILPTEDISGTDKDAAYVETGGMWRMPTRDEWDELCKNCDISDATIEGQAVTKYTSRINGNVIVIPKTKLNYSNYQYAWTTKARSSTQAEYFYPSVYSGAVFMASSDWGVSPHMGIPIRPVYAVAGPAVESLVLTADKDMYQYTKQRVSVTALPEDAVVQSAKWTSSDPEVASVDGKGNVLALAAGTTTITLTDGQAGISASVTVTVEEVRNNADADGYVDLGLSVMWCDRNLGAASPAERGDTYLWGYTTPTANNVTSSEYKFFNQFSYQYQLPMRDICGNKEYDPVACSSDGAAQMPSKEQATELLDNCDCLKMTYGGQTGYMLTSRINGRHIFFPFVITGASWHRYLLGTSQPSNADALLFDPNEETGASLATVSQLNQVWPIRGVKFIGNENITLNSLSIEGLDRNWWTGDAEYITVVPDPAGYQIENPEWETSDSSIATVIKNIHGYLLWFDKPGTVTVTVTVDGVKASAVVTARDIEVNMDRTKGVHMGDNHWWWPVYMGAETPFEWGDLYYHGGTAPQVFPSDDIPKDILQTQYDVAHVKMGDGWHMPTPDDYKHLVDNCDIEWIQNERQNPSYKGALFTSRITGEKLYFHWTETSEVHLFSTVSSSYGTRASADAASYPVYELRVDRQGVATTINLTGNNSLLPVRPVRTWTDTDTTVGETVFTSEATDVYDLSGVCVARGLTPAEARTTLPAGLYILRGETSTRKLFIP